MKNIKELTKAEDQVMQILWKLEKAFVKEMIDYFDEPKPAYNTVSTIIRILEKKGFVAYNDYGKTYQYYPLISKTEYKSQYLNNFIDNYFENSYHEFASFFTGKKDVSLKELEKMKELIENEIKLKSK